MLATVRLDDEIVRWLWGNILGTEEIIPPASLEFHWWISIILGATVSAERLNPGIIMLHSEYERIKDAANRRAPEIVARWLSDGRKIGKHWEARNPTRNDQNPGSFKINLSTGQWYDFATGEGGQHIISLGKYLHGERSLYETAENVSRMIGFKL